MQFRHVEVFRSQMHRAGIQIVLSPVLHVNPSALNIFSWTSRL